ncbi:MAG TPA: hypothetical protein VJU61_22815, partial [Polyangiaceae bacterium]|nr:hypothetical protein [Polyangiaceae bacterium]
MAWCAPRLEASRACNIAGALLAAACWDFEAARGAYGAGTAGSACEAPDACGTESLPREEAPLLPALTGTASTGAPTCGRRNAACCTQGPACASGLVCDPAAASCIACAAFRGLGFDVDQTDSHAVGISADGSLVVGYGRAQRSTNEAMYWSLEEERLGRFPRRTLRERTQLVFLESMASAASFDGRVVVGFGELASVGVALQVSRVINAFIAELPGEPRDMFEGEARGVSADGSVVVGAFDVDAVNAPSRGFVWSAATSRRVLAPPSSLDSAQALGVSHDGSVAVGYGTGSGGVGRALSWRTETGEVQELGELSGSVRTAARATNHDGSVIVGVGEAAGVRQGFVWRSSSGALESLAPIEAAGSMDAKGELLGGTGGGRAWLWDTARGGARALDEELGDLVPSGWVLQEVTGISADGRVLVGYGISPGSVAEEAWVAFLGPRCE